ncbi:Peroxiredoxin [Pedobacter steynii]|uniref:Peroxiredoxin n=1 Tax=Pedobacter steynii TaxID=430522 RepID=A0A1G9NVT9_9SPHI|nr:TlpA disulfide reductase family protein [Pedobacter steynii]NQX39177.1 TlpA family protein disulfide reductase [Pedobacter steynii]SDL90484.1 Peroxiredoxin [Pedobacter steynii]
MKIQKILLLVLFFSNVACRGQKPEVITSGVINYEVTWDLEKVREGMIDDRLPELRANNKTLEINDFKAYFADDMVRVMIEPRRGDHIFFPSAYQYNAKTGKAILHAYNGTSEHAMKPFKNRRETGKTKKILGYDCKEIVATVEEPDDFVFWEAAALPAITPLNPTLPGFSYKGAVLEGRFKESIYKAISIEKGLKDKGIFERGAKALTGGTSVSMNGGQDVSGGGDMTNVDIRPDGSIVDKNGKVLGKTGPGSDVKKDDKGISGFADMAPVTGRTSGNPGWDGKVPPSFEAVDMKGKKVSLDQLKGKVVMLNFWFIACHGCVLEMPMLNELVDEYKGKDVVFIGITGYDKKAAVERFLTKKTFKFDILADAGSIVKDYNVTVFPLSMIIGKDGKVVYSVISEEDSKTKLKMHIDNSLKN